MRSLWFSVCVALVAACTPRPTMTCHRDNGIPARVLGVSPTVMLLDVELAAGGRTRVRSDGCQEALVYLRSGHATIALGDDRTELDEGDAARLVAGGPGPASLVVTGATAVLIAYVRGTSTPFDPGAGPYQADHPPGGCAPASGPTVVVARAGTTGPHAQGDGSLRVFVHLDGPHQGSVLASLGYLDAEATVPVPEHDHPDSTEHLYFESVSGTLLLGETTRALAPGDFVVVPRGMRHAFTPTGDAPLRAFQLYAPSGPEQRFLPRTP